MAKIAQTLLTGVLLAAGALWQPASGAGRGAEYFSNAQVVTQDGESVKFYDDLIRDRMVLISFIFTSCKDLCPINTARLALVAEKLGDRMGKDIFFVSISVDPENDTPEKLKAFRASFYEGPGWTFITGDPATLKTVGDKLGNRGDRPSDHRNEVIIGNDATGEWARNTPFGDIESLALAVLDLDPEWRARVRIPPAEYLTAESYAHLQISSEPGQALFKKLCSACHTVGVGDRAGPDLLGVTERRPLDWLVRFLRDPQAMRRNRDPVALDLVGRFPGARMPSFGLSENDAADLIAYLEKRTADVETARAEAIAHGLTHEPGATDPHARGAGTAEHAH